MIEVSSTPEKGAVAIDCGVDLMERLLQSDDKNWKVEKQYLRFKHNAPNLHTIFNLEDVKCG